jgi:hypothetical protein
MKLTLKFILISAAVLVTSFNMQEAKAQAVKCFDVSSRTGWQYFDLGGPYTRIASVGGGWSVDARSYARVGPQGHNEPGLEPYNQYKYDQGYPFGALFVWVRGVQQLPKPITRTAIRINDADNALGDNSGVLRVCFSR